MEKIEIKHFDLEFERNVQTTEAFVELYDTYFRYVSKYDSEKPKDRDDLGMGWVEQYYEWDIRVKRENFVCVEKYLDDKNNYWQIEMEISGYPNTIKLYYEKDNPEMEVTFEKLFNWVFIK